ncbi:MAG: hypothetical protein M1832_001784 [Thelocarpon impressellum]|nr:MAG: hypothetical protein M1832_001784 [Thelocarpon impressellum]
MAQARKYAGLPDLDSAPDVYETGDANLDGSTVAASTVRSPSPGGSDADGAISREHLHPSQARDHFLPARVDASDVDFSDRIAGQRRSYRASWRRLRRAEGGAEASALGDFSDEEDEPLAQKLSRLRRETREAAEELERRKGPGGEEAAGVTDEDEDVVTQLCRLMERTRREYEGMDPSATGALQKELAKAKWWDEQARAAKAGEQEPLPKPSTIPTYPSPALVKAADFDARLTLLENALGIPSYKNNLTNQYSNPAAAPDTPIIPAVKELEARISVLSESELDGLSRRARTLASDADALALARQKASSALEANGDFDAAQTEKINALYATLPTIERMSPTLSVVLERLKNLRHIHTEAAGAAQSLERLEEKRAEMDEEIRMWREGLGKVEEGVRRGEEAWRVSVGGFENDVRVLEGMLGDLQGN